MANLKEKVGETADKFFTAVGTVMDPEYDGPGKKIAGAAEIAVGATGWVASKVIHKAQGPLGHWINKRLDRTLLETLRKNLLGWLRKDWTISNNYSAMSLWRRPKFRRFKI